MNKKENFLKAVQILAPDDQFILQSAHCVAEESLPAAPGGAALEFIVAMQRLTRQAWACKARFKLTHRRSVARTSAGSGTPGNQKPAGGSPKSSFGDQGPPGNRSCRLGIERPFYTGVNHDWLYCLTGETRMS